MSVMDSREEGKEIPSISDHHTPLSWSSMSGLPSPLSNAHVPSSPTPSDTSNSGSIPPSPTLSHDRSGPSFSTTLQLRDNRPQESSGLSSLDLLNPGARHGHLRKGTNPTSTIDVELALRRDMSTKFDVEENEDGEQKRNRGKKDDTDDEPSLSAHETNLSQDQPLDPHLFRYEPNQLADLLDPKDFEKLRSLGGIEGLLRGLGTDPKHGLSSKDASTRSRSHHTRLGALHSYHPPEKDSRTSSDDHQRLPTIVLTEPSGKADTTLPTKSDDEAAFSATIQDRRRFFGENVLPARSSKTLLQLIWAAMKDRILILLSIAAVVSLALGFFQDFGTPRPLGEPRVDWVEGVTIIIAIAIVVFVGSLHDWQHERMFKALNEKKERRGVMVIRDGVKRMIDVKEVVVGDIALVEPGEIIPCDGIFLSGHNVRCDESAATGESDEIRKVSYHDVNVLELDPNSGYRDRHTDCFMISGSKVVEGVGRYVVVAVGTKSFNGRIMMALWRDQENTPLQSKLNNFAEVIAKMGFVTGVILFVTLMIKFFVQLGQGVPPRTANENGIAFINILIISVTLIVVAVPEGLPLAVRLTLAFATKRMRYDNLLVRDLGSCETMAHSSVICTDKTGTLTQNSMTVVAGSIGIHAKFVRHLDQNAALSNAPEGERTASGGQLPPDFSVDLSDLNTVLSPSLQMLLNEAIAVNSSAFQDTVSEESTVFLGSRIEAALLTFARELKWPNFQEIREAVEVVEIIPFSSERKAMAVIIKLPHGGYRGYFKGASEVLSRASTSYVVVNKDGQHPESVETRPIDQFAEENISRTIIFYGNQTLHTIAICYRDFPVWPPPGIQVDEDGEVSFGVLACNLTLTGVIGIEDLLREGVRDAVMKSHRAGVAVKMCTGDNLFTARSIATQCGIFTEGGIIMEGPVFRKLTQAERINIVPRLQVLARSSPREKKILVETLKMIGEVVAVTGDGTNDGLALKTADVGFSMGIAGTEVAKETSDIILMDDHFSSIVKAIMWGRCVNDAVRKFLQFQISANITAVIITFVSAVASTEESSVLSAVQLLWINIIMDTFAALALVTDPATESLLDRKPDKKSAPLFSVEMYKMILIQSIYQLIVILGFHFRGIDILGFEHTAENDKVVKTLVFNAFVFAQIFNSINCRRLDSKLNIFEGILKNKFFIAITLIEIVVQILIVFVGGAAFQITPLRGREWGISLILGVFSIPLGAIVRLLPNKPFEKAFKSAGLMDRPEVLPTVRPRNRRDVHSYDSGTTTTHLPNKQRKAVEALVNADIPAHLVNGYRLYELHSAMKDASSLEKLEDISGGQKEDDSSSVKDGDGTSLHFDLPQVTEPTVPTKKADHEEHPTTDRSICTPDVASESSNSYSKASSRTQSTDYGLFYTRRAYSEEVVNVGVEPTVQPVVAATRAKLARRWTW